MRKPAVAAFSQDLVRALAEQSGLVVRDVTTIPARAAKYARVPSTLHGDVRSALERKYSLGLYDHQLRALDAVLHGRDICLSTATASGKSLVFVGFACHLLLRHKVSRVLALYPARALIQDQIAKWQEWAEPFGISVGYLDGG